MQEIFETLDLPKAHAVTGDARWPSVFSVTDLATACFGAVGAAVGALLVARGQAAAPPDVSVDARLASLWFDVTLRPDGWDMPPIWDAIAGDYAAADGWIRLHTNLPHHRVAALQVLDCEPSRAAVSAAVRSWDKDRLETEIVAQGGAAAAMRSVEEWQRHPQGIALSSEPLIAFDPLAAIRLRDWPGTPKRPLAGLRVLDLTRVIAGPVATRLLAGLGAEVLRIDPPGWDEGNVVPDVTRSKRCARLDLKTPAGRECLIGLLAETDLLVHGYRADALEASGLGREARRAAQPNLIEVTLDAYGWTGPWANRRGFDSLVQMSTGIAEAGRRGQGGKPVPLPVQALDHATGCLMAAAALRLLTDGVQGTASPQARLSLARTARLLAGCRQRSDATRDTIAGLEARDLALEVERTDWGPAQRLRAPLKLTGVALRWETPARALGTSPPEWSADRA